MDVIPVAVLFFFPLILISSLPLVVTSRTLRQLVQKVQRRVSEVPFVGLRVEMIVFGDQDCRHILGLDQIPNNLGQ
jgi:hypothetical protein